MKMDDNSNMPHLECIRSLKTLLWNKKKCERAKTRVQVVADIQNCALRARYSQYSDPQKFFGVDQMMPPHPPLAGKDMGHGGGGYVPPPLV